MLLRSIRRTPSQIHSLQQIPTQHDMLPHHLVYKNELNREYVITLARNNETPWWWSEKIEICRSGFKWKLYRCICWLIVEVIRHYYLFNDVFSIPDQLASYWLLKKESEGTWRKCSWPDCRYYLSTFSERVGNDWLIGLRLGSSPYGPDAPRP